MNKPHIDKAWLAFGLIAIIFLALKTNVASYSVSDENTYYKMGELVSQGQTPYKDFFLAHFPLQVYMYAAVFKIFGFNILILKMLSAFAMVASAAFVSAIAKEKINSPAAIASSALFLFSYGTLLFSNFPTGAELSVPLVVAGFYFFLRKKNLLCGVMIGIGTGIYQLSALAFIPIFLAAVLLLKDKKAAIRLVAGFGAVVGIIAAIFFIIAKGEFVLQTVLYHLRKPTENIDKAAIFFRVVKMNVALLIAAMLGLVFKAKTKAVVISIAIALAYIAIFPLIKQAFNYYLIYALPFLAIISAYGADAIYRLLFEKARLTKPITAVIISSIILAASFASITAFKSYDFQKFENAPQIASYVEENSSEGQTIFGDDSTVPLISLLSHRQIALNMVDNNEMLYTSGTIGMAETLAKLKGEVSAKKLKFVMLRKMQLSDKAAVGFGIGTDESFSSFLTENCVLDREFISHWGGLKKVYQVYDCLKT